MSTVDTNAGRPEQHATPERLDGDRGIPQVGRPKPSSRLWFVLLVGLVAVTIAALAAVSAMDRVKHRNRGGPTAETETVTANPRGLAEDAFNVDEPPPLPTHLAEAPASPACALGQYPTPEAPCTPAHGRVAPGGSRAAPSPAEQAALDLAERRKRAPVLMTGAGAGHDPMLAVAGAPASSQGALGSALTATRTGAVSATRLTDPDLMLTQGRLLPCTLETALSSQTAGMASCVLARDVYSTNGRVLLLERGSRIVGQYRSGQMRRGLSRIFVLWTRVETPHGVLVQLDSPAADALGRSGIAGEIDTHFWERFGAALLVSLVDDAAAYGVARARDGQSGPQVTINGGGQVASDAAAMIVERSIDLPPTLEKAPGASVGVFVARDVHFGDVYGLRSSAAAP